VGDTDASDIARRIEARDDIGAEPNDRPPSTGTEDLDVAFVGDAEAFIPEIVDTGGDQDLLEWLCVPDR